MARTALNSAETSAVLPIWPIELTRYNLLSCKNPNPARQKIRESGSEYKKLNRIDTKI